MIILTHNDGMLLHRHRDQLEQRPTQTISLSDSSSPFPTVNEPLNKLQSQRVFTDSMSSRIWRNLTLKIPNHSSMSSTLLWAASSCSSTCRALFLLQNNCLTIFLWPSWPPYLSLATPIAKNQNFTELPGHRNRCFDMGKHTSSTRGSLSSMACTLAASKAVSSRFKRSEKASASSMPITYLSQKWNTQWLNYT